MMKTVQMNCQCLETSNRCDLCGADFPKTGKHCFKCHMFFCDPCCVKNVGIRCQCFVWVGEDPLADKHRTAPGEKGELRCVEGIQVAAVD
jgi:hypothetical protein